MKDLIHGYFTLEYNGDVLIAHNHGAWNEYTSQEMYRQLEVFIRNNPRKHWSYLADNRYWDMATPEGWEALNPVYSLLVDEGMLALGMVCNTTLFKYMVDNMQANKDNPLPYGLFFSKDYDEILKWCSEQVKIHKLKQSS
ncbi:hypothetical protein L4C34_19940 [Vibrio profundum]|uniref:hypothetical protein n=1 Tax=Vibrio profundum TaxID=2910247 RepID=UPI003D0A0055